MNEHPRLFKAHPRNGDPAMRTDDFTIHMPPHIRPEFVAWLAKREAQAGWRGYAMGHEQGYWEGRDEC